MEVYPEINFERLQIVAAKWAAECAPCINKISFFLTTNKSNYKYFIDIVLNDPPKIEPESGYIGAGSADYLLELSEVCNTLVESDDTIMNFEDLWGIDARWQTSEPNPYIVEESEVNLYVRKESFKHSFTDLRIDKLKELAQNWALDYKKAGVIFRTISLFRYRAPVPVKRYVNSKYTINPDSPAKIPTKYAIIFDLMDYEWKNLPPEEWHKIRDSYHDFIYCDTHFMNANSQFSSSLLTDFNEIYRIRPTAGFRKEWVLLPRCKNLYQTLPENIIIEQGFIFLYDSTIKTESKAATKNQHFEDEGNDPLVTEKESSSLLPCSPGTEWKDISIILTSEDQVRIKTPEGEKLFHYAEMGMANERNKEIKKRVWTLLMSFAHNEGVIDSDKIKEISKIFESPGKQTNFENFMQVTKELNKHLKDAFEINDSIYIGDYRKMWKDEQALKSHIPHLFVPKEPINGEEDLERQRTIWGLLAKKGYATKFKIAMKRFEGQVAPVKEKNILDLELEDMERKRMHINSRTSTSYNPS